MQIYLALSQSNSSYGTTGCYMHHVNSPFIDDINAHSVCVKKKAQSIFSSMLKNWKIFDMRSLLTFYFSGNIQTISYKLSEKLNCASEVSS